MKPNQVNLIVYDKQQNFLEAKLFFGSWNYKNLLCVESIEELDNLLNGPLFSDEDYIYLVVHAFYSDNIRGIRRFFASRIKEKYPNIGYKYISEGKLDDIRHSMINSGIYEGEVCSYSDIYDLIEKGMPVYTKQQILTKSEVVFQDSVTNKEKNEISKTQCDYVIITALEVDEMENILPFITKVGEFKNSKQNISYGHLNSNSKKKIAFASQRETGMVDAAILTTELILKCNPKYVIMPGVLGGRPGKTKIADVIVSTRVFTVDKGKITSDGFDNEIESVDTNSSIITTFIREKNSIEAYISKHNDLKNPRVEVHFSPIASVRHVIDKPNHFNDYITLRDRKAIGLEMESYGVARACQIVDYGKAIPIIVKSVMDNTTDKDDKFKSYAAWTSAMFVKYILENDLI